MWRNVLIVARSLPIWTLITKYDDYDIAWSGTRDDGGEVGPWRRHDLNPSDCWISVMLLHHITCPWLENCAWLWTMAASLLWSMNLQCNVQTKLIKIEFTPVLFFLVPKHKKHLTFKLRVWQSCDTNVLLLALTSDWSPCHLHRSTSRGRIGQPPPPRKLHVLTFSLSI